MTTQTENASSLVATVTETEDVQDAHTTGELMEICSKIERKAGDLVASPIVKDGYLKGGHPASLAFQHLNVMTSSRIKKMFPLANKTDPLFAILYAKGKEIVAEEITNKYKARAEKKFYDYISVINKRFSVLFKKLDQYKSIVKELGDDSGRD